MLIYDFSLDSKLRDRLRDSKRSDFYEYRIMKLISSCKKDVESYKNYLNFVHIVPKDLFTLKVLL